MAADVLQPARPADARRVRAVLAEAIDASPYYDARFKANEKRRLDETFLRSLIAIDPWHIALLWRDGEIAGLVLTIPEYGTLWSPWIYVAPQFRTEALGLTMIRVMLRHWDHGRFHKIACYVRPDNRVAKTVFARFGFAQVAHLKSHLFGEDYLLLERPLTKTTAGYDDGVRLSRVERWKIRWAILRGRLGWP
jgi:RimJ/RimL family protein N-acetyltransferase